MWAVKIEGMMFFLVCVIKFVCLISGLRPEETACRRIPETNWRVLRVRPVYCKSCQGTVDLLVVFQDIDSQSQLYWYSTQKYIRFELENCKFYGLRPSDHVTNLFS